MKIRSIIRRKKGHTVKLDDCEYPFIPDNDYVCDVKEKSHLAVFIGIPEGYEPANPDEGITADVIALIPEKNPAEARVPVPGENATKDDSTSGEDEIDPDETETEGAESETDNDESVTGADDDDDGEGEGEGETETEEATKEKEEPKPAAKKKATTKKRVVKKKATPRNRGGK